ncbi:MAG: zf-HC2 domain-containing protein [Deltaproteobacteria bacterium]|nr:zf-HC2 domain-containing protein [Deltaproteobacteria bacterium]
MSDCQKYQGLLMGLLDQELTPEETVEVNGHLTRCENCRKEYEELRRASGKIEAVSFIEPQDEVLEQLWKSPYSRLTRNSGLLLVLGGVLLLIIYGIFEFVRSGEEAVIPKIGVVAVLIGCVILLLSVLRERIHTYKADPYKEVKR